ncbi:MAG TPA: GNAT family N-acetyltransferase [Usitatibacter sp.]|nr:GNAT family N-acetyltransferase [Usitatibacter sp.]
MGPDERRLEELALNSSAPPGQLVYDGWLLRLLNGQAKRARSVNAIYPSREPLEAKIAYCERLYARAGLPAIFRMTPFSEPASLDAELERRGYGSFDPTAVEAAAIDPTRLAPDGAEPMDLAAMVEAVGAMRGSPPEHRRAHLARLEGMPLALRAVGVRRGGRVLATGLTIVEDDCAGLFDIITDEAARRAGHARSVVSALLAAAWELGARHAYLQVKADNEPARRLYREFGFGERYRYWYRGRPGEQR